MQRLVLVKIESLIIIFLDSAERVNQLLSKSNSFVLGDKIVSFHRFRSPASKIILSNVSPTIPNVILENYLINALGLELKSPISILRISPTDEVFGHIITNQRQVYIKMYTKINTPPSFIIEYKNRSYRIFITRDEFTCFKCHQTGHKAEDCNFTVDLEDETEWMDDSNNNDTLLSEPSFPPFPQLPQSPTPVLQEHQNSLPLQNQHLTNQATTSSTTAPSLTDLQQNQSDITKK